MSPAAKKPAAKKPAAKKPAASKKPAAARKPAFAAPGPEAPGSTVIAPPAAPAPVANVAYCKACGNQIHPDAAICVNCGVAVHPSRVPGAPVPKDKTVAVLLAVFLGFWTWIYTWQTDQWKFWTNLGLTIVTIGIWGIVAWIWAIIDVCVRPAEWYQNYPNG